MTPLKVLVVEDSATDTKLILHALRHIGRPIESERVEEAWTLRAALEKPWDLVISDWSMPKFSAVAALYIVRHERKMDVPFIIVSGTVGEDKAVEAMRAGAHDYVLKDTLTRLCPAVERELREHAERLARRQAEEAVRVQEARFRALVEKSAEGLALVDGAGNTLYLSPPAKRMLGLTDDAPPGVNAIELVHPEDRAQLAQSLRDMVLRPSWSGIFEFRVLQSDGTLRWIEGFGTNLLADPAVGAIVGNLRDVTERRRTSMQLRESETRFARLAESGVIGIAIADVTGRTHEANDAYLHIVAFSREELEQGEIFFPDTGRREPEGSDRHALEQLRQSGVAHPYEKEFVHRDGTVVPVLIAAAMLNETRCIAIVTDLTDKKHAEVALHASEVQLRQAQKMEALGTLAGGVAHDFNNLLSVILSYSQLMLGELKASDPMRGDIEAIEAAGDKAASLTRQLLMFSRQQLITPRVLDLSAVIGDMNKMLRRLVGEDVMLLLLLEPSLGKVKIDATHIEQVVMNLVVNARESMPTGGTLTVETANVTVDELAYVLISVADTGRGMDDATAARIFEPFFTTKEVGKGTGLGLSTVFGIVHQNGGTITVTSEVGKGSTFRIHLPRTDERVVKEATTPGLTDLRGSETILLVEDEAPVRIVATEILKRHGYRAIVAANAGEALLLCESHQGPIDLLLTDVVMPMMSGPALARRLAASRPEMKILYMSGYTNDAVLHHGVLDSSIMVLQKPLTPESMVRKVREVLGSK